MPLSIKAVSKRASCPSCSWVLRLGVGFGHALYLFHQGAISVGDIVAYMGLLSLFTFPTNISLFAYSQVSSGISSARRILELIRTETALDQNQRGLSSAHARRHPL